MFNLNGIRLNVIGFGVTIVALILSLIPLIWTSFGLQTETYLRSALLIFNLFFVSAASLYLAAIYYFYEKEKDKFSAQYSDMIKKKDNAIYNRTNLAETVSVYSYEIQRLLQKFLGSLDEAYDQYSSSKCNIVELLKRKEVVAKEDIDFLSPDRHFEKEIKSISNRFFRNTLDHTIKTIESYLKCKEYVAPISLAVKRKDFRPDRSTKVTTFFRDYETFRKGEREIEQEEYTIENNSDFAYLETQCKRDYHNAIYIMNDVHESKDNYMNESQYCPKYYDATIVVPIANFQNEKYVFGYLACDTKKPSEQSTVKVFDKEGIGRILLCAATSMAIFWHYSSVYLSKLLEEEKIFIKT